MKSCRCKRSEDLSRFLDRDNEKKQQGNSEAGVAKIGLDQAFKGVLPFLIAHVVVLFMLVLFPEIVTVPLQWWMR